MGFFRVLGILVLAILAVGLAGAIFQTGYLAGAAADGSVPAYVGPYGWQGWGWGFGGGLVGFLGFLLFLFIFIAIIRAAFGGWGRGGWGRGGWGRGGWGPGGAGHYGGRYAAWEERAREVHDEWHRRNDGGSGGGAGIETGPGSSSGAGPGSPSGSGPA